MSVRKPVLAGNWKMYKTAAEAAQLAKDVAAGAASLLHDREVVVAPPFTALAAVKAALAGSGVALAGQNMHPAVEGAFTGEVSPVMLKDAGCSHVILGHSERRQLFGETDEGVAKKTEFALQHGLTPIVCVGESLAERESNRTTEVVERQTERALRGLDAGQVSAILIAYEPVWAIGTGKVATPEQAQEVHAFIRKRVTASHGDAAAAAVRILYGGSVKPDNIAAIMAGADVDGALVGGASLTAPSFLKIVAFDAA